MTEVKYTTKMAAPRVTARAIHLQRLFSHLHRHPSLAAVQLQHVCFKGSQRGRAPAEAKVKDKWVPRTEQVKKKEYPKNYVEKVLSRVPEDDVWVRQFYRQLFYTMEDAMTSHRELAQPAMLNNMEGLLHLDCTLNMKTKKKTKFMGNIRKTILLPHPFDDGTENRVVAFCKSQEEKEAALAAGAAFAGGVELVKTIEKGEIRSDDWEHVVTTLEMVPEIAKIRKPLKDSFPHKKLGTIGDDIAELVGHFIQGRTYESTKKEDAVAEMRITIGKLSMPMEQLMANFRAYVEDICELQKAPETGQFIMSGILVCPPSNEKLHIQSSELLPAAKETRKKTSKLKSVAKEEEEESGGEEEEEEEEQATAEQK